MPELSPRQLHRAHLEARRGKPKCLAAEMGDGKHCLGPLEADHFVEVRWIKQTRDQAKIAHRTRGRESTLLEVTLDELTADGRNSIWLCGNHNRWKCEGKLIFPEYFVPAEVFDFFEAYPDLDDRYYHRLIGEAP